MSGSTEAARSVTSDKTPGMPIGVAGGTGPGAPKGVQGEKGVGVSISSGGGKNAGGVSIGIGGEKKHVEIGIGGAKSTGISIGRGEKSPGVSAIHDAAKSAAGIDGGGKSAGASKGLGVDNSAKGASSPAGFGDAGQTPEKSVSPASGAGMSVGVSIPESVVAPLIGAGANVYIMTNELTQSMREKLGTSWPFVQDTLNSRYAKILAGGLLASVAVIVVWKVIKRFSSRKPKGKKPSDSDDEESNQWTTKTYELTPVPEGKPRQQGPRSEGDGAFALPHKIQLRIAEAPLQAAKVVEPEICKARDPATRHRHTRHLEPQGQGGEQAAAPGYSPWHNEHHNTDSMHSSCPNSEMCDCDPHLPPQPRLLYSVRESRMVQRAIDPSLENILTHTSCPSSLCHPTVLGSDVCVYGMGPKSCCLFPRACAPCGGLFNSPMANVNCVNSAPGHLSSYPTMQPGFVHGNVHSGAGGSYISTPYGEVTKTGTHWPAAGVSVYSVQESHPRSSTSAHLVEDADCQASERDSGGRSQTLESKARSVSQQTDGQPVEVDLDMPGHGTESSRTVTFQTGRHNQNVPTRTAQSPVTPSQCTSTPIRADNSHVRSSVTCPTRLSTQSCIPTVCNTPQVVQLSTGGEYPGSFPAFYQQTIPFHTQHHAITDGFGSKALPPLTYHPYVSVDRTFPSLVSQQQQMGRVQPQHSQQQQKQSEPVIQHPSESSVSQNSTEACPSQESRQYEGSQTTTISQETAGPEMLLQERALLPQPPYSRTGVTPPVSPPHNVIGGHHHASPLRALTDYTQPGYPWQRPQAFHSFQPSPVCLMGYQSPNANNYSPLHSPWSVPQAQAMFLTPTGNVFVSSPRGMLTASSPGLLPSAQHIAGHWQTPYLYPQGPITVPKHTTFSPNFNLSNSNAHVFMQEAGENSVQMLPFLQKPSRQRVMVPEHSISNRQTNTTVIKTKSATVKSSGEISVQTVERDAVEIVRDSVQPISGSAPGQNVKTFQSSDASQVTSSEEGSDFPLEVAAPEGSDQVQEIADEIADVAAVDEAFQADPYVVEQAEEASCSPPPSSAAASALSDGRETQL